jgi:hypothetical protein
LSPLDQFRQLPNCLPSAHHGLGARNLHPVPQRGRSPPHPIPRHAHQRIRMPWLPPDRRQPTGQLAPSLQIVGVPNSGISSYPRKLRVALAGEIPRDEALQPPRQLPPLPQGRAQPDRSIPREPGQLGMSVPQEVPRNGGDEASWELLPRLEVCTGPGRPARSS